MLFLFAMQPSSARKSSTISRFTMLEINQRAVYRMCVVCRCSPPSIGLIVSVQTAVLLRVGQRPGGALHRDRLSTARQVAGEHHRESHPVGFNGETECSIGVCSRLRYAGSAPSRDRRPLPASHLSNSAIVTDVPSVFRHRWPGSWLVGTIRRACLFSTICLRHQALNRHASRRQPFVDSERRMASEKPHGQRRAVWLGILVCPVRAGGLEYSPTQPALS